MNGLFETDRIGTGRGSHYHVGYLNESTGLGAMGEAKGHTHRLMWHPEVPPTPPGMDPMTGMPTPPNPGQPAYWEVEEVNGHTHTLGEYEPEEESEPTGEEATETVSSVLDDYKNCKEHEQASIEKGVEAEGFYFGDGQWTLTQRDKLKKEDRACLTINKIKPQINTLLSYQIEQRVDPKFRPVEGGDQRLGELADIVVKNILYRTRYHRHETRAFRDAAVPGRGILGTYWDTSGSLRGDICVRRYAWDESLYGPHDEDDASDVRIVCNVKWYTKDAVKAEWPKKAKDIQTDWEILGNIANKGSNYSDDEYNHPTKNLKLSPDLINLSKKQVKVIERWKIETKEQVAATVAEDDFVQNITNWDDGDIDALGAIPGIKVIRKKIGTTRRTVVAGSVLLEDKTPADIPAIEGRRDYIPQVVIYCYKNAEGFHGQVEVAKDPQREINKRHSQAVDVLNRMDGYGEFYDETTFVSDEDRKKYQNSRSRAGFLSKVAQLERKPQKVEGIKFPSELVQMMEVEESQLQSSMNIVAQPYGANESGAALLQKQKLKVAGQEFLFENLRDARARLMKMILAFVQEKYEPERIFRIVKNSANAKADKIGGKPASEYSLDEIKELISNKDLTELDLVIDEAQWTPTIRMANAIILTELAKNGQVPPEVPIEMNDTIPRSVKDKVIEMVQQQRAAQAQAEKDKQDTEIKKTLLAKELNSSPQAGGAPSPMQPQTEPAPPPAMIGAPSPVVLPQAMPMMSQAMPPVLPQPVNIDVNVNINDKGKRVVTLGPISEDGSQVATIDPMEPVTAPMMEEPVDPIATQQMINEMMALNGG